MKASKLAIFAIVALALLAACGHQVASLPNEPPASDRDIAEHHDRFGAGRNDRRLAWGTVAARLQD